MEGTFTGLPTGKLVDLTEDECWALLASRTVGRIAWQGTEGLTVVPMNYVVEPGALLLRTAPYTAVARECDDHEVAFQVDRADARDRSGWSVLVRGRCHLEHAPAGDTTSPDVWAPGTRRLLLRINARQVSGRRLA